MPNTPLRALRVPDDLWRSAQARALTQGENLSVVVRRALRDYVEGAPGGPRTPDLDERPAHRAAAESHRLLERRNVLLVAQGMVMQQFGQSVEESAAYLERLASASGDDVEDTARRVVDSRGDVARWACPSVVEEV